MSQMLPEGIDRLDDCPYTYFNVVRMGLGFLSFDELPKEERPSRRIWLDSDEMRKHWTAVEQMREEKYGLKSEVNDDSGKRNAAARDLIR